MKLRFHSNSLRLRLSQPEVVRLIETGRVDDAVAFSLVQSLFYSIESGSAAAVGATLEGSRICVVLPEAMAKKWAASEQAGIEGSTGTLQILIEKDYQCLHRTGDQDADSFPNPLEQA